MRVSSKEESGRFKMEVRILEQRELKRNEKKDPYSSNQIFIFRRYEPKTNQ